MRIFKEVLDFMNYYWPHRKTKLGFVAGFLLLIALWVEFVFPYYETQKEGVLIGSFAVSSFLFAFWLFYSGRMLLPINRFTVVFCLRAHDPKSITYIKQSFSMLKSKLDELGLWNKFKIISIGRDIIVDRATAHDYRERHDIDIIIWGDVFCGSKENKAVCDFKGLSFTSKIPGHVAVGNLSEIFKSDINIALVSRDWNIYEVNSLPDAEKISANLSEIILFVLGIIYCQYGEYAEHSVVILEHLFRLLSSQINKDEKPVISEAAKTMSMSAGLFRHSRVLGILLNVYKNLGSFFAEHHDYRKAKFYLDKFRAYEKNDIAVLSNLAVCAFYIKDISAAKGFTDELCGIDRNNEICLTNRGFFGIHEKNYQRALYYYKEVARRERVVTNQIIVKVIAFLDERKTETPKELAYDFAIGVLNFNFIDKEAGVKELRKFVKKALGMSQYEEMINFANSEILDSEKLKRHKRKRMRK